MISDGKFRSLVSEGGRVNGRDVVLGESLQMPPDFSGEPYLKSIFLEI